MDKVKGIIFAALSAATFGLIPLYANQAIIDGVNNETILVYRYGIAGIVYAIYLLIRRVDMRLSRAETKEVLLAGVGGYGVTAFFLMWSYHYMPTGVATAIHFFYPVVVAILMMIFYKERLPLEVRAGIVLAICGVYLLSWTPGEVKWWGLFFVLMSTVTYGCYITALNRPVLKAMKPDVLTCYVLLFTAVFYVIVALLQGKLEFITRPRFLLDMTQLAILSTIVSARLLVAAVKLIGSVPSSVLGTLEPITAIAVGVVYFREQLTYVNYIGLFIVIAAVLVVVCRMKK
ncbi:MULTISPECIES: DMT family transporter [Butyricimonas]|uniref:DMT family transporter n=1 Tax=Butyricimonas TaxID=574697 RepID=UPI0007FB5A6A|nr:MULTISPECIES: DMT family transporter [Butyricimonas]